MILASIIIDKMECIPLANNSSNVWYPFHSRFVTKTKLQLFMKFYCSRGMYRLPIKILGFRQIIVDYVNILSGLILRTFSHFQHNSDQKYSILRK